MRAALLGCGRVAEHYRKMLLEIDPVDRFEVVAVCDTDPDKAARLAQAFGCPAFRDAATMLDAGAIDVMFVLTPSGHHFAHARLALENGVSVVCEKPVTMTPEEAAALDTLAETRGLFCATVFQNRWNRALRAAKAAVETGRLKTLVTASVRLHWCRYQDYYEDGWHGTWAMDGGVINQQAIHHLDALQWICGPVDAVCAVAANRMNTLEAEDTLAAVLRFKSGALATIEATTAARPRDFEASLSVVGEGGRIRVGGIALNRIDEWDLVNASEDDATLAARCSVEVPSGYGLSHSLYIRDLVDSVERRTRPDITIASAMSTLRLVHALYASVETGAWVRLDDNPRSSRLGRS
ncbi:Gfo/Idh/MocA family protein [Denitromonas iodatirespirans]|uniref:Gfo/Idh/MocA family oxidoreductase n=1 Tax=Denitromonas iodatirespirans TaxID=2795389 RepID=A0A944DFL1_DENI1|nr:Gfo/Idh/MocA family oxidoreductase [Denitromonas iodatirespirans]MBT0963463.1 Gfo/Idh/MocA family oxidoreductase [Denitromonas iodatirespirans]